MDSEFVSSEEYETIAAELLSKLNSALKDEIWRVVDFYKDQLEYILDLAAESRRVEELDHD